MRRLMVLISAALLVVAMMGLAPTPAQASACGNCGYHINANNSTQNCEQFSYYFNECRFI